MTALKPEEVAERLEKLSKTYGGQSLTSQLHSEMRAYSSRSQFMGEAASLIRSQAERIEKLEEEKAALISMAQFGDACFESWPEGSIDGGDLQDMLMDHGLIAAVPGGFNENVHIDAHNCCPEQGDEWLMPTKAALAARDVLAALERT